jgi:SAM-dependent methyltransferase
MVTVSQKWDKRVGQWHDHVTSAEAFGKVLDRILVLSQPRRSDVCVDLGAGTGFVTTALAPLVASVLAVDISPAMAEALAERVADAGLIEVRFYPVAAEAGIVCGVCPPRSLRPCCIDHRHRGALIAIFLHTLSGLLQLFSRWRGLAWRHAGAGGGG